MRFYVTEQFSPNIATTPEGFLVCRNVPITRTGTLLYRSNEVPVEADSSGMVNIDRMPEDVFREATIASFEGKPITIDHPDEMVNPENWKALTVGTVQGVHQGEGDQSDLLLADFLVTDSRAINLVRAGLREVSCGYDADYEQVMPGKGYQRNIIGNHVALVSKGRAGARCSIQDSKPCTGCNQCKCITHDKAKENQPMAWKDKFMGSFKKILDEMKEEDLKELEEKKDDTKDAEGGLEERMKAVEETLDCIKDELEKSDEKLHASMDKWWKKTKDAEAEEEEAKKKAEEEEEKESKDKKTKDSASVTEALSRAEILMPGVNVPTKDGLEQADGLTAFKKKVLKAAIETDHGKDIITTWGVKDFDGLSAETIDAIFIGASELAAKANNSRLLRFTKPAKDNQAGRATPASINKRNAEFWAGRK